MDIFEVENCLNTMSVIVDKREQPGERADKRYSGFNIPYSRATLNYGDYTYNAVLPDGTPIYDESKTVFPKVVVERKMDLDELANCFTLKQDKECKALKLRNRFEREFYRATQNGARCYLLIEDSNFEKLLNHRYNSKFSPKAFFASLMAWQARYDLHVVFCQKELTGKIIKEILYRELKERLENGEYDNGVV
ncbi:MAG: ERCC4 domain-containing protein [Lachnospiraceae bacterium]|nr:ERCC4 domain-containing protein [Lachnospiraceae bacterium]